MRVLIIVPGFPQKIDEIKGGVHAAVANLLTGFQNFPIDVRLISFNKEVKQSYINKFSTYIDIQYYPEGNFPFHSLNYLFNCARQVKKAVKDFQPDIIHYEASDAFLFTKVLGLVGRKYLLTIHGIAMAEGKVNKNLRYKLSSYFNGMMEKIFFPKYIIHLSEYSKRMYANRDISKYSIIPNAIVPNYYSLPVKTQTNNKLLYIGGIDRNKNILFLLNAMHLLQKENKYYYLEVLGGFKDSVYQAEIETFIKENGLENYVHFHGWVTQTQVLSIIKEADILVVSSLQESLPMVIAECMAAGKTILAATVGGIPEMVTNEVDGYLFHTNNIKSLVQPLSALFDNSDQLKNMSAEARKNATERYHCKSVAFKTIEFYKEVIGS